MRRRVRVRRSRPPVPGVPERHRATVRVHPAHLGRQSELPGVPPLPGPENGRRRADRATSSSPAEVASDVGSVRAVPRSTAIQLWGLRPAARRRVLLRAQPQFPEELVTVRYVNESSDPGAGLHIVRIPYNRPMAEIVKVTTKGQLTLPARIRKDLGISKDTYLLAEEVGDFVLLRRAETRFLELSERFQREAKRRGVSKEALLRALKRTRQGRLRGESFLTRTASFQE